MSPLYTPEDFLDSRVGTLPAINNPRTAALMVQRGHRDQLPSNYGVARRVEPEAKFFNDFSRARACARAQGSGRSGSVMILFGVPFFLPPVLGVPFGRPAI